MRSGMSKMTVREIKSTFGRWIAIFAIVALGVGFFSGLRITRPAMVHTTNEYLREHDFYDFRLLSTLGLTEEDAEAFGALNGVKRAVGSVSSDALFSLGGTDSGEAAARFLMLTPEMNTPALTAGRLPQSSDECLLDRKYAHASDIGTKLYIAPDNDADTKELFAHSEYTVVGLADSPLYLNYERGTTSLGSGSVSCFVYIPPEGFEYEVYTEIYVTLDTDAAIYTDAYDAAADAMEPRLSELLTERAALRRDSVLGEARDALDEAKIKLADAEEEYRVQRADAERELNDAKQKLTDGAAEIEKNRAVIAENEQKLADAERELEDARAELAENEKKLADGRAEVEKNRALIAENEQKLADAERKLADAQAELAENEQKLADARTELEENRAALAENEQKLEDARAEIAANRQKLVDSSAQLREAQDTLDEQQRAYEDGLRQLDEAQTELKANSDRLSAGKTQLAASETQLAEKEAELQRGQTELDAAQKQLDAAYRQLDALAADPAYASPEAQAQLAARRAALDQQQAALNAKLADARAAKTQLDAARLQLESSRAELTENEAKLNEAQRELEERRASLPAAREALSAAQREINDGWEQLRLGGARLDEAEAEAEDAAARLADGKARLADAEAEIADGEAQLADGKARFADAQREVADGRTELDGGKARLADAEEEIADGEAQLADGKARFADAEREVADGKSELAEGKTKLADAERELADGQRDYDDARAEADEKFADAEAKISDAQTEIADGEAKLGDIAEPQTYALGRDTNIGYTCFDNDSSIVQGISRVFPVFFFAVAALVCVTTMTRMVNDQRTQIGTLKALGYGKGAIMKKYVVYSGSAALLGCILGYCAGILVFPAVIWRVYGIMYGFSTIRFVFRWTLALVSLLVSLACSVGTTWLACRREFSRCPAALMRPKAPKAGRRILLEYLPLWKHVKFLRKVSIRNIVRYKKRLYMMVLGIGGCTALLITGFGIRDSIQDLASFQYGQIMKYDATATFADPLDADGRQAFAERYAGSVQDILFLQQSAMDALSATSIKQIQLLVVEEDDIGAFIDLHSGSAPVSLPGPGEAIVSRGLAEALGIGAGGTVTLRDGDMHSVSPTVAGVFDNYVFNYVIIRPETYAEGLGTPETNAAYLSFRSDADPHAASAEILGDEAVVSVSVAADFCERITNMLQSLDYIVILVTGCAAALAFIVLYNLTNINITERQREIATIKVLGFYRSETAVYIFRENMILTAIGAFVGLFLGRALHAFVMGQIRVDWVRFDAIVQPVSYVWSIALTFVFAMIVALLMNRKLDRINMADSLKSVE